MSGFAFPSTYVLYAGEWVKREKRDEIMNRVIACKEKEKMSSYILWNQKSSLPPTVVFGERDKAIKAAAGMAHKNPGEKFYVCKLVHSAEVPLAGVQYEQLDK